MSTWPKGAAARISIEVRTSHFVDDLRVSAYLTLDPARDPTPAEAIRMVEQIASGRFVVDFEELRRTVEVLTRPSTKEPSKP